MIWRSKLQILKAAREVFSEKGYDGAGMSEVAKRAGVNKALPFYYFKSKENLLKELVRNASGTILDWKDAFMKNADLTDRESLESYFDNAIALMESRREMIGIILSESFKSGRETVPLFDFIAPILRDAAAYIRALGNPGPDDAKLMTAEMFFDAIPLFAFAALGQRWAARNSYDYNTLRADFFESFKGIYIDYIYKKHFANKK